MSFGEDVAVLVAESNEPLLASADRWERVPLGTVAEVLNGFPWKSDRFGTEGVPIIRIRDVTTGATETRYDGPIAEGYWVEDGDLLVGMDGDFNVRRWKSDRGLLNQRVCKITTAPEHYSTSFLEYALPGYLRLVNRMTSSVTVKHLSSRTLAELPLPLPPAAEQRRIVAKLEALTARLARARAELDRVPVLAGKLRGSSLDRLLHPGEDALTTTLAALGRWSSGGTPSSSVAAYYDGPIPWLRSGDLPDGPVVWHKRSITEAGLAASAAKWVPAGSVLIAMYGATIGKLGITTYRTTTNQAVATIEPASTVDRKWLFYSLLRLRPTLIALGQGGAQPNISQQILKALPIALPGLAAQQRAAAEVEAAFARADRLEAEATRARALIDRLEAAILARAFRGELVPQDPADEPASVLLDRIRAQRAAAPKPKRGRRASAAA